MNNDLIKTFNELENTFTSSDFYNMARRLGVPENKLDKGKATTFLHKYATQQNGKRSRNWTKKQSMIPLIHEPDIEPKSRDTKELSSAFVEMIETFGSDNLVPVCVQFLKRKGHKILKQKTEFIEI